MPGNVNIGKLWGFSSLRIRDLRDLKEISRTVHSFSPSSESQESLD